MRRTDIVGVGGGFLFSALGDMFSDEVSSGICLCASRVIVLGDAYQLWRMHLSWTSFGLNSAGDS